MCAAAIAAGYFKISWIVDNNMAKCNLAEWRDFVQKEKIMYEDEYTPGEANNFFNID